MDIVITHVIPDSLGLYVHGVGVRSVFIVLKSMSIIVPPTTNVGTYQTDPQVLVRGADRAVGGIGVVI